MSKFNLLNFTSEEAPFCCGMEVVGDFYEDDNRRSGSVFDYGDAVQDLRNKLLIAEARPEEDEIDEDRDVYDGYRALIATVPTDWEYRHKLLLDAGMVEVKRWVNVNSGNELALLVSPDEWPPLK